MSIQGWQKSSFSGSGQNDCIEVARRTPHLHLRESDQPTLVLSTSATALSSLLTNIKGKR